MKKLFTFFVLLLSFNLSAANYYWVGGSGNWTDINHWRTTSGGSALPSVIPGPTDNVFFDAKSGFTAASKTITIDNTANCHNITFSGSVVAPTLIQKGIQTLNIYGSSEWQTGMADISISSIYYRHTGEAKTIKSNGVMVSSKMTFEEENSLSLLDDFSLKEVLTHLTGTWNTNGHKVTFGTSFESTGKKPRTINLGNSQIYLTSNSSYINTSEPSVTVNAGTSHFYFTTLNVNYAGMRNNANQTYYDVTFDSPMGAILGGAKYNRVEFKGNGFLLDSNTFKNLIFSPTKTYTLQSDSTQTVTNLLSANTPQCGGWSTVTSNSSGLHASIVAASGVTIDVSGVIMKDIKASGGANFTAVNSVDNGNNIGWTFPAYVGQNLHWIGGSGNWNDKSHWSQTSGGVGGYCVPGPSDNTFFDAGSGFTNANNTITIDNISYTRNVTFSGSTVAPILKQSGAQYLNIYGSSEWQTGMVDIFVNYIYYRHTGEAKTIKSNGVKINSEVFFEEENSISLLDDLHLKTKLNQVAGTWNTNGHKVTLETSFESKGTKPRTINLGSSQIYLTNTTSNFNTQESNITINAGTSHIHFTTLNVNYAGMTNNANQTYYDVTFEGPVGALTGGAKYNRVEYKGNGFLSNSNTFKELIFSPTKTYSFQANTTQTITKLFSANTPNCGGWSTITSATTGIQANIVAASGVMIDVSGVIMKDISASGGANFRATNSVDNGNNLGWTFPAYVGQNLYWVGGSGNWNDKTHWSQTSGGIGGYCVPGPADNTFFDAGSGFSETNKTVNIDNISYTRNVTFSGSTVAPILKQSGAQYLNIYGSSEWQSGMTEILITYIYYRHTGEAKTIKSNDVKINSEVFFEEENSISLIDDFYLKSRLTHVAGTWNTNGHKVTFETDYRTLGTKPKTINLGASQIYLTSTSSFFDSSLLSVTVNAETSHFYYSALSVNYAGMRNNANQTFYNVTFNSSMGAISGGAKYNRADFKGNGSISGSSTFKDVVFTAGKTYNLGANTTQTIENLTLGGTPCDVTFVQSSVAGTRANVNVTGTVTNFNFGNLKDINASGKPLHFAEQSTIANQNNFNITYDPYNPGAFEGLGADWVNHKIDNSDPSTYLLSASKFYGNNYTSYKWYKIGGLNSSSTNVISTDKQIDIRKFGFGTYKVQVEYSNGNTVTCIANDDILLKGILRKAIVNPNIRIRVN